MAELTPQETVAQLDRYIVGQTNAKRALAIALRNRYRRRQLPPEMADEIMPKNMIMIGPTGVGKTELARRIARMQDAPFLKVEATKFTEVGYVGRDVESIVRDLMETAITMVHDARMEEVQERAEQMAQERIINAILSKRVPELMQAATVAAEAPTTPYAPSDAAAQTTVQAAAPVNKREQAKLKRHRKAIAAALNANELDEQVIEIETEPEESFGSVLEFVAGMSPEEVSENIQDFLSQLSQNRRRSRQVSVREARRILTTEEANKLINWDAVVETAAQRVEEDGIVFLDEIDKIARTGHENNVDVSGEGVQRDLLPIVEGSTVMTRYGPVKTDHILFVAAGAFYNAKPTDLIPELQGRFPLRVELTGLTEHDFVRILTEPDNALTKQYTALMSVEKVDLSFSDDGVAEVARVAVMANERHENIGARRLNTVIERVLEELSFEAPKREGERVVVDREYVQARLADLLKDEDLGKYIL